MFREFNVKFEDVEMLGGADNLLEGTEITKVIVRGDNNEMSSLDSMLKNCNELDTIDGELDLNGVGDIDNLLEGTELVKSINLKNINNENISANNSFPHVDRINIGGELYNKKAMQNVIASKDWTFDNINYQGTVSDNIVTKEVNIVDDNKATIQDTLERKAKGLEIIGQTYENLVVGSGEVALLDELTLESIDGSPNEFTPHIEQPVCVESIEGETYQNLIEGKGEYKLTDTFSTTWTESNNSIENPPSMIEIPEIWGNTVQGYANVVTSKQVVDSIVNSGVDVNTKLNADGTFTVDIHDVTSPTDSTNFIQLKANTKYSVLAYESNKNKIERIKYYLGNNPNKHTFSNHTNNIITTDSSGKVLFFPNSSQGRKLLLRVVEGQVNLSQYDYDEMDLNYIQSVGDLYVDESGEPILDEEGNEQYKLDILSYDYKYMPETSDNRTGLSGATKDGDWSVINHNIGDYTRYSTTNKTINRADYGDLVYASFKIVKLDNRKFNHLNFCTRTGGYTYHFMTKNEYNDLPVNVEHFQSTIQSESHPDGIILDMSFCEYSKELEFSCKVKDIVLVNLTKWFGKGNEPTREWCDKNIKYVEHEDGEILYGNKNKTTILMPQQLSKFKSGVQENAENYSDKLYYDTLQKKYFINSRISKYHTGKVTYNGEWGNVWAVLPKPSDILNITSGIYVNPIWIEGSIQSGWGSTHSYPRVIGVSTYQSGVARFNYNPDDSWTNEEISEYFSNKSGYYLHPPKLVECKILEKPSLETYSPKTYISTNTEIQPSQMTITNKKVDFIPLGLQANKDYTLQLDSVGKDDKPITVNLGGTETTIQPTNDTSKHHKVVVRTPSTLTTDKLDLNGEGVIVNDVMLFEGGSNEIKQEVEYVEGIQNIGELQEDGTYKIDILSHNGQEKNCFTYDLFEKSTVSGSSGWSIFDLGLNMNGSFKFTVKNNSGYDGLRIKIADTPSEISVNSGYQSSYSDNLEGKLCIAVYWNTTGIFVGNGMGKTELSSLIKEGKLEIIIDSDDTNLNYYYEKESTQSILLPQPLNKIGDIKDKFYWDEDKGYYCIEQSIGKIVATEDNIYDSAFNSLDGYYTFAIPINNVSAHNKIQINSFSINSTEYISLAGKDYEYIAFGNDYSAGSISAIIRIKNERASNKEELLEYIKSNSFVLLYKTTDKNIIDLPHLNKKYSLDTYMPTTYVECTNSPMQPSRLLLESDTVRYKPSTLETDTDYTVQFDCKRKGDKKVVLDLGGTRKEFNAELGLNHVEISTNNELTKDRLYLSGEGNTLSDIMLFEGSMNQYPSYFDGMQSVGELQEAGSYKIDVSTNNGGFKNLFGINNFFVNSNNRGELIISSEDNSITSNYTDWYYTVETNIDLKAGKKYLINLDFEGTTTHTSKYSLIMLGDKGYNLNSYNHADFEKVIEQTPYTEQDLKASFNIVYTPSSDKTIYFGLSTGLRRGGSIKIKNIEIAEYNDNLNMDIPLKSHNVAITSNSPLAKGDKLYWNKSNKRYEIDRSGSIEVPTVSGDIIDLPRLYQREDTHFSTSTGNIKPSKIKLDYNDLD